MKLTIDLEDTWTSDETLENAIKELIHEEVGKEIRKMVKVAVDDNKAAVSALANAYTKRMISEAQKALNGV